MADTASAASIVSSPNNEKCCKKLKTESTNDKLSKLPDGVLSQILSSFPTKEVVRTSILSKKWRYIWTTVPNLDFDDQLFVHPVSSLDFDDQLFVHTKERQDVVVTGNCFRDFVNRVFGLHCVMSIQKFRFSCRRDYGFSCFTDWINAAITRTIEEIDLSLFVNWQVLPPKFFISENLVVLKLHAVALMPLESVHFPSLKTLYLNCVKFVDDISMKILLSGCPILEKLNINREDEDNNAKTLYISSHSLKSLQVDTIFDGTDEDYKIVIESPNLQRLELGDRINKEFRVTKSASLEKVYLDISQPDHMPLYELDDYGDRLLDLLRVISNIKDLNITGTYFSYTGYDDLPVFHNLRSLTLAFYEASWDTMFHMLDHSPILQNFTIEKAYSCSKNEEDIIDFHRQPPSRAPGCLLACLENIEVMGFEDNDGEMGMLAYFLKNAMVLKKIVIVSRKLDLDNKSNLLMFPRSSSTCEVVVLDEIWPGPPRPKFWDEGVRPWDKLL